MIFSEAIVLNIFCTGFREFNIYCTGISLDDIQKADLSYIVSWLNTQRPTDMSYYGLYDNLHCDAQVMLYVSLDGYDVHVAICC